MKNTRRGRFPEVRVCLNGYHWWWGGLKKLVNDNRIFIATQSFWFAIEQAFREGEKSGSGMWNRTAVIETTYFVF